MWKVASSVNITRCKYPSLSSISLDMKLANSTHFGQSVTLISWLSWILYACNLRRLCGTFWIVVLGTPSSKLRRAIYFLAPYTWLSDAFYNLFGCSWSSCWFLLINTPLFFKLSKPLSNWFVSRSFCSVRTSKITLNGHNWLELGIP
jgi:hypothetical protein